MTPGSALQGMSTHNVAQPDLTNQHCVGRNEVRNAFISVGQMRTDADFPIAADFHAYQGIFHTGHRLTASKDGLVVNEGDTRLNSNHVLGKMLHLFCIQRNLVSFV